MYSKKTKSKPESEGETRMRTAGIRTRDSMISKVTRVDSKL